MLLPAGGDLLVTASDPDGGPEPLTYTWSFVGGPAAATFAPNGGEDADQTVATFGAPGVYQLRVAVSDGQDETSAELYVTASDGSVPGAVDGAALHLTKGSYSINFQRDNADRLLLAGRFRRDALPADPGGIAVSCFLNGSLFAPAQALDSIGRYASPRGETPALRYQFKPADGSFSLNASSADLAPLLNPANRTGKGAHLIHVRLRLEGGGLGAPLEAQGAFAFTFNSSRDRSSRGAFNFAKDPVFDGAFAVTRATAKALPDPQGGGFKLTLSGGIAPRGGGPLQLVDELVNNADLRIVLDGHAIEVSFHTLRVSPAEFAKRSFTFNPRSFGIVPPDLQALRFSNANRTFAVTSKGLLDTGIPPPATGSRWRTRCRCASNWKPSRACSSSRRCTNCAGPRRHWAPGAKLRVWNCRRREPLLSCRHARARPARTGTGVPRNHDQRRRRRLLHLGNDRRARGPRAAQDADQALLRL
ncbi:MAG: PKD domain-containing protein [Planctomycetota bacterium]|nr:PKD domain-containing protein [Planctomycetota bacterium]